MYYCNTYMTTRTIRDVDEKTWRKLKIMSAEHNAKMGELVKRMADEYEKRSKDVWKHILDHEKLITDKEAEEMLNTVKKLRKEQGFR